MAADEVLMPPDQSRIADPAEMIRELRERAGPGRVEARREAERAVRELLNHSAGRMTSDQVLEFGRLVSADLHGGYEKHGRFAPAFVGATIQRLAERLEDFNRWTERLWSANEQEAQAAVDTLLKEPAALFGAGRSLPTMFMYLRDPERYAVWMNATDRGLQAVSDFTGRETTGRTCRVPALL